MINHRLMATLPENFLVKRLKEKDVSLFQKLINLFIEVFEDEQTVPSVAHLSQLLKKPDFIAYVAIYNNEVVGGLTAYELVKYYSIESELLIYDIAIKPEFQRRGIGKTLLESIMKHCDETGIKKYWYRHMLKICMRLIFIRRQVVKLKRL